MLLGSPGLCMYSRPVVQILLLCAKQSNQAWIVTTPEPRDVDNLPGRGRAIARARSSKDMEKGTTSWRHWRPVRSSVLFA
jgi:hypothetical protein